MQTFQLETPLTKDQDTYWPVLTTLFFLEKIGKVYPPYTLEDIDLELISEQRLQIVQPLTKDQTKKKKDIGLTVFNCLCLVQSLFN